MFNSTKEFAIRNTSDVEEEEDTTSHSGGGESDLMISEYVEGSSNNKYLEIYNAGTNAAELSKYVVKMYSNGGTSDPKTTQLDVLTGLSSLSSGGIIVIKNSSAALTLPPGVTAYASSVCGFNGDDVITLEKDGVVIDVFGTVGIDPGDSWTIAGDSNATKDKTVRRKHSVAKGNTDWSLSSSSEWEVISTTDDVSNIGTR
jgi:predicted extracellular nuclease